MSFTRHELFSPLQTQDATQDQTPSPVPQQDQGQDRLPVFPSAVSKRKLAIQERREQGLYGRDIAKAERIAATTPDLLEKARRQGFSEQMIKALQTNWKIVLSTHSKLINLMNLIK